MLGRGITDWANLQLVLHDRFGDLNYRLQKKIQNEVAFAKIFDDTWQELLSIDQLNIERACNRVFAPFRGVNPHYGEGSYGIAVIAR